MFNDIKDMYNNLSYNEQQQIYKTLLEKQNNIINDFRAKKDKKEMIDYSLENGNNFLEPVADIIYNFIIFVFPGFKKNN